jgi:hypothetical protein
VTHVRAIIPSGKTRHEAEQAGDIKPEDLPTVLDAALIARSVFGIGHDEHRKTWVMSGRVMELLGYGECRPITNDEARECWKMWEGMRGRDGSST